MQQLVTDTGFFSPQEVAIAVELVEQHLQQGSASGYFFLFADDHAQPQQLRGYSCYGPIPQIDNSFDLYWLAVAPSQQGLGLGKQLLQSTESLVQAAAGQSLIIETSGREQYLPTRRFYEAMAYRISEQIRDFYGPGDDKIIYRKDFFAMERATDAHDRAINNSAIALNIKACYKLLHFTAQPFTK
ncbi:GNAT family N-acetyltransferase [Dasania sp. GY-MA-18]|uniref:GNAT family N-acetyltransferase n=1 Tax=Dasania phycosphaerae TaxID=2950436 RepID=A0A9J6RKN7_9GAMM|nr:MULTISPECIES: GNAT family N-acetyltransferase [Dasania]MCR8922469.1 GNAT family N-acetyltransferase [Dasania sp. GY-MA-18]MCZ0864897.1 GNAT family N-acetyltransferase [Dasania phycosphaerae]MCZ0868625.1 GNAT family N-acetyltransferase [Dasania phycosphaerae]